MRLDYDLVRNVLLILEEDLQPDETSSIVSVSLKAIQENHNEILNCTDSELLYTIKKLEEAGYITTCYVESGSKSDNRIEVSKVFSVKDITFAGHEYLNSVRDSGVWESICSTAKTVALNAVPKIAEAYVISKLK